MTQPDKKSTVLQIAKAAGVSTATVSRVMNQKNVVKSDTYRKVVAAMETLGCPKELLPLPNKKHGGLILFNVPSLDNPFYNEIVRGAKASALRLGYPLLINAEHLNQDTFDSLADLIKTTNVSGIITLNHISPDILEKLNSIVPVVQCCEYEESCPDISYVGVDDFAATKTVMDYILSTGRKKVAFLSGPLRYKYARQRRAGYLLALEKIGVEPPKEWMLHLPEINFDIALSAATHMLNSENRPDAVFAVSDVYAAAVIKAAWRLGIHVPNDLIVVGFDNVNVATTTNPSLTTVNQPKFQLGYIACDLLAERMENPSGAARQILLTTELIVRESSTANTASTFFSSERL